MRYTYIEYTENGDYMKKRILKCAILFFIVVAIGVFLETDANREKEKSKQKKPTKMAGF